MLQSPNIVRLLQYGIFHDRPYMAMEYISGSRTLQGEVNSLVVHHKALDLGVVRHLIDQILNGLEAAHREQIIHRDIKPENIMLQEVVGDRWFVKLVDFGLAKVLTESRETSMVLGTVHYMAPEQIEGKDLGPWTDLYAVGVIAFQLMVGQRPFPGKDSQEILRYKLDSRFDPVAGAAETSLPPIAVEFLRRALHRWPEQRFRSTDEMRAVVARVFDSLTVGGQFFGELSGLVDSADLSELRRQEQQLATERRHLDQERERLGVERQALASERIRLGSEQLGTPAQVEHAVIGPTGMLINHAPTVALHQGTMVLGQGVGPTLSSNDINGLPSLSEEVSLKPAQNRRWQWLALAAVLLVVGGVAATGAFSGADPAPSTTTPTVLAQPAGTVALAGVPSDPSATSPPPATGNPEHPSNAAAVPKPMAAVEPAATAVAVAAPTVAEVPATAQVLIKTTPPRARVTIDGAIVGISPHLFATHVGARHQVVLSAQGHVSETTNLNVTEPMQELSATLAPAARQPAVRPSVKTTIATPPGPTIPPTPPPTLKDF